MSDQHRPPEEPPSPGSRAHALEPGRTGPERTPGAFHEAPEHQTAPIPTFPAPGASAPAPAFAVPTPTPPRRERRGRRVAELGAVAVLAAMLASGGTVAATTLLDDDSGATTTTTAAGDGSGASTVPVSDAANSAPDWDAVAETVSPSVVAIGVSGNGGEGEGSGVVWDEEGHVVTNAHVVDGAQQVSVTLADGVTYEAEVTGSDTSTDIAVLRLTDPPDELTPVTLGSSDQLTVGDAVMAIGNPLGLDGTVTTGIVSALDRPVATQSSSEGQGQLQGQGTTVVTNAVQTSAAINPGNSGGALVDAAGRLIGINSSIASLGSSASSQSGSIGIGFAIPVDQVKLVADQLVESGTAEHAFLGVTPADGEAEVGSGSRTGARVEQVVDGSPAADAGLQEGDVITELDGKAVGGAESLVGLVRAEGVGTSVPVTYVRDGQEQTAQVTLVAADG